MKSQTAFGNFSNVTNGPWFAGSLTVVRVLLGVQFLLAGVAKFGDWSAEGFLAHATGPFAEFYMSLAGNPLVDFLNVWGLTLIGLALILGIAVRPAAFFAAIMMVMYYFGDFEGNTAHGIIDFHLAYASVFLLFLSGGVGHVLGLDSFMMRTGKKQSWWKQVLFG